MKSNNVNLVLNRVINIAIAQKHDVLAIFKILITGE